MSTLPEESLVPRQGWWGRNWKWLVPGGCLGLLLSCGCLGALFFGLGYQTLRSTGVFVEAVTLAKQSPEVQRALGEPIEAGLMIQGSIQSQDGSGSASFSVPLEGPLARGLLRAEAYKEGAEWRFTTLLVELPGRPPILLIGGEQEPPPGTIPFPEQPLPGAPLPEEAPPAGQEEISL